MPGALTNADVVFVYSHNLGWDVAKAFELDKENAGTKTGIFENMDVMVNAIVAMSTRGDQILVMSNGGFGGVHGKILAKLAAREMRPVVA